MFKVAWSSFYNHPLPEGHRFPMIKYDLIKEQLILEGTLNEFDFFEPIPVSDELICKTHDKTYLKNLKNLTLSIKEIRKTGFPLSLDLVKREILIAGGTVMCCDFALDGGVSMNVAGGTHHAYHDYGEGFCLLNDQAIAANYLLNAGNAKKILIVDLDVHQGNGTATLFADNPNVITLSFHGAKNYPFKKEVSDYDVAFDDDVGDEIYLELLEVTLMNIYHKESPDFIFYQSGVDALMEDKLGRLSMTVQGLKARDEMVLGFCYTYGLPVVVCMGGGYSNSLYQIVEAHSNTFRVAAELYC